MANGFRPQKKLTQMQLTQEIALLNSRVDLLTNVVAGDIKRLNILLFSYLKEQGKAQEIVCPKCEVMNIRPFPSHDHMYRHLQKPLVVILQEGSHNQHIEGRFQYLR